MITYKKIKIIEISYKEFNLFMILLVLFVAWKISLNNSPKFTSNIENILVYGVNIIITGLQSENSDDFVSLPKLIFFHIDPAELDIKTNKIFFSQP